MNGIVRRGLICLLTIAMIVGGMPLAHAMPCATIHQSDVTSHQHQAAMHHQSSDAMLTDVGSSQHGQHRGKVAMDSCNCGCATFCAADMLPVRVLRIERRGIGVRYPIVAQPVTDTVLLIDPGIPILAA